MFYYLYQITNNVNGKIYVGVHRTKSLDDGYMGSGKVIKHAMEKYGAENFTKVILEFFENAELMYAREKEVVNDEFLLREDVYNLRRGGNGGFDYINSLELPRLTLIDPVLRAKGDHRRMQRIKEHGHTEKEKIAAKRRGQIQSEKWASGEAIHPWSGRSHSSMSKEKISDSMKGKQVGEKNSQFGSMWINNGKEAKKIKNTDAIPDGWRRGRKIIAV